MDLGADYVLPLDGDLGMKKLLISFLLAVAFSSEANAARGFGSTLGVGSTDVVVSSCNQALTGSMSISVWTWYNGIGGGTTARVFDQYNSGSIGTGLSFLSNNSATDMLFIMPFSGNAGKWRPTSNSANVWHHWLIVYNASSVSNNPTIYMDGVSRSVLADNIPTGTATNLSSSIYLGNRQDGARNWNGRLAEFAIWNGALLNANEASALWNGASPLKIHGGPTCYVPLNGFQSGEPSWGATNFTNSITGTKFQPGPWISDYPFREQQ
jgi:hypothetical protein